MKIALINDTHFGARNDSEAFDDFFYKFYDNVFFPTLKERNITTMIHLGDITDRRKFINYRILDRFRRDFMWKLGDMGVDTHIIIGNHDTYFKNTNKVNSMDALFTSYDGQNEPWIYSEAQTVDFDGCKILMMPWINPENYEYAMKQIEETDAQVCFGHLEIKGFMMYKGHVNHDHGVPAETFNKFDLVASGHFHHKSSQGNIHYLGNPYQITWSDYDDIRGFHIFDTETRELEFIPNPYTIFEKILYDDRENDYLDFDFKKYEGKFVKLVVVNKINTAVFDRVVDNLSAIDLEELKIIEDFSDFDNVYIEDEKLQLDDTLSLLNSYIENIETDADKNRISDMMKTLYVEASNANVTGA